MSIQLVLSFIAAFVISACVMPLVMKAGTSLGIVAEMNNRTVHDHPIVRIGGYAIYVAFLVCALIFLKTDTQINSILIGGFLVFGIGLLDDVHNLSPKTKLLVEIVATTIVVFYGGILLDSFTFFGKTIPLLNIIITYGWILGIINAINLIDGLDGLCGGISIIALFTISLTSLTTGRTDIASLSLILAGAIAGFLLYNFHPAKVFMGDSGALFIGFMISTVAMLGFGYKTTAFFTLGAPIVVLMIPIMDTLIAIVRRKVHHKSFSEADRGHMHHQLMFKFKLGQVKSVLILYGVTILFSLTSFLWLYNRILGFLLFIVLMLLLEFFVEYSEMISRHYKPLMTILNFYIQTDKMPMTRHLEAEKKDRNGKYIYRYTITTLCTLLVLCGGYIYLNRDTVVKNEPNPYEELGDREIQKTIYKKISSNYLKNNEDEGEYVAAYFLVDYLSIGDQQKDEVGGLSYVYKDIQKEFKAYALKGYYQDYSKYTNLEVEHCKIVSFSPSSVKLEGLEENKSYDVTISYKYNEEYSSLDNFATVTVMNVDNTFYVIGIENE